MTTNGIYINCRWGGTIIRDDNGVSYEGGEVDGFILTPTTTYTGLRIYLCNLIRINHQLHKVSLICRFPVFNGSKWVYRRLRVNCDEKLRAMCDAAREYTWLTSLDMYVVMVDRNDTTTVVPEPVVMPTESVTAPTQYKESNYQPHQVFHPNPVYNNSYLHPSINSSYVNISPYSGSLFEPSAISSSQPYGSTTFQGQGTHNAYCSTIFEGEGSQTECNQHQSIIDTQESTFDDVEVVHVIPNIENNVIALANSRMDPEEEVDADEVLDAVNNEDDVVDANVNLSEENPIPPHFDPPAAYFSDTCGFENTVQWEPKGIVRTSIYDPKNQQPRKGLIFENKHSLQDAICLFHIYKNYQLKVVADNKSMWEVCCKHANATNCAWRLRGSEKKNGFWEIATYHGPHTCVQREFEKDHPQLTAGLISRQIAHFIKVDPAYKIVGIKTGIQKEFKVNITYNKAWYAKQIAIADNFGAWDSSYADLPRFLVELQKTNPGTVVEWDTIDLDTPTEVMFDRVFWAFKPSIDGFQHCRPIVSIDATFLYGKYSGNLLIAMSKDGADKLFPLAFAIVDKENLTNWSWFLRLLRRHVAKDRKNLCIIADCDVGILGVINDDLNGWGTTQMVHHRFCPRHVQTNFYKKFPDSTLKQLLWEAGTQKNIGMFEEKMNKIKEADTSTRKAAWNWISALPVEKWALAHDGGQRYGVMTTNISESFNGVLRAARFLPITACVQVIFFRVVGLFYKNNDKAVECIAQGQNLTPHGILLLGRIKEASAANGHRIFNRTEGEGLISTTRNVQHIVHLLHHHCSCGAWAAYHFPCEHAMTMCMAVNMCESEILPQWCSTETFANTWTSHFHPVRTNKVYWEPWTGPIWIPNPELLRGKGRQNANHIANKMDHLTK